MNRILVFLLLGLLLLGFLAGLFWLTGKYLTALGLKGGRKGRFFCLGATAFLGGLCLWQLTAGLFLVHLLAAFGVLELGTWLGRRLWPRGKKVKADQSREFLQKKGLLSLLIVCILFGYGYYTMNHIVKTEYTILSDKLEENYKIVLISDTHFGTVQNPDLLAGAVAEINGLGPDLVLLGGDIVEEGTSKAEMEAAFRILGDLKSKYGSYFVYGNHDRQSYSRQKAYTEEELTQTIQRNGIRILKDETVEIGKDLLLAGREDAGARGGRASVRELLKGKESGRFCLVADHQAKEAAENAAAGVDLLVSGHTHGGQIFPGGLLIRWMGRLNYGLYQEGGCRIIVSSGAGGWGVPLRTQARCEYVVIHLQKA